MSDSELRNPFAIQNGEMILIEDLSLEERGNKCQCYCPHCTGDFIAKMGEKRTHHFAHSKDACDEVLAYTAGLYMLVQQILKVGHPFYLPAVVVSFSLSSNIAMDKDNINDHIKYVTETSNATNEFVVSKGQCFSFKDVELCYDNKRRIQALELAYMNRKMAITIKPPDTVCKSFMMSRHKDMATLVLDFSDDAGKIQKMDSNVFQEYLLSEKLDKRWVYNPKVKEIYPQIFEAREKSIKKDLERWKQLKEEREVSSARLVAWHGTQDKRFNEEKSVRHATTKKDQEKIRSLGYEQVKNKSFEQNMDQIRDSFGNRWFKCKLCGKIKPCSESPSYGGQNSMNLGECYTCRK